MTKASYASITQHQLSLPLIYSSLSLELLSVGLPPNAKPKQRLSGWRLWMWVWGLAGAECDAFGTG